VGNKRLLHTRIADWYAAWLSLKAPGRSARIPRLLDGFAPDAILTVVHGYGWLAAAAFAAARGLPLHLICHDDWPRVAAIHGAAKERLEKDFGRIYRQAATRFCVSPYMRDSFRERYGVDGTVLYPSRAADAPIYAAPPERSSRNRAPFTVAFAGTINSPGYARALVQVADALAARRGCLQIFGPLSAHDAEIYGLARANVMLCGLISSGALLARLRAEADVLLVPMSFQAQDQANMKAGFPSKLADYSALGLPLLVYGPAYCSAVRWAKENAGAAEVVETDSDSEPLTRALERLAGSPELRNTYGKRALALSERYFSHAAAQRVFHQSLSQSRRSETSIPSGGAERDD